MSEQIQINAEPRRDVGKGASRRLRRAGDLVPGVVYGGSLPAQPITVNANQLAKAMQQEAFYSRVLDLVISGESEQAVVRDLQRHPVSEKVLHIDFLRVRADHKIQVHVPLHFLNEDKCAGVRIGGGSIVHNLIEVEVSCLPADLPEHIEVDLTDVGVGQSVLLTDLALPQGVAIVAILHGGHNTAVVSVRPPRGGTGETEGGTEGGAEV
jgi:large subunit ribosomal protein L25